MSGRLRTVRRPQGRADFSGRSAAARSCCSRWPFRWPFSAAPRWFFSLWWRRKPPVIRKPVEEKVHFVDTVTASRGTVSPQLLLYGNIVAGREVELRPLVSGRVYPRRRDVRRWRHCQERRPAGRHRPVRLSDRGNGTKGPVGRSAGAPDRDRGGPEGRESPDRTRTEPDRTAPARSRPAQVAGRTRRRYG